MSWKSGRQFGYYPDHCFGFYQSLAALTSLKQCEGIWGVSICFPSGSFCVFFRSTLAISASTPHFERMPSPIYFLADYFRGQLNPLTAQQRRRLSRLLFFPIFLFSFFFNCLSFIHTDNVLEIEKAFLSETVPLFSQRSVFRQTRTQVEWFDFWSLCNDAALKGTGCYRWACAKLFLWNQFYSIRSTGTTQRSETIHLHDMKIVCWFSPLQFTAILKTLKGSLSSAITTNQRSLLLDRH